MDSWSEYSRNFENLFHRLDIWYVYRTNTINFIIWINKDFTSSNIFNNSSCLLDFILPYLFRRLTHLFKKSFYLASNFSLGHISFILVIGIGLKKEAGLLLKKTSIIYSWRDFFAKSIRFINWELGSFSLPKLLQINFGLSDWEIYPFLNGPEISGILQ